MHNKDINVLSGISQYPPSCENSNKYILEISKDKKSVYNSSPITKAHDRNTIPQSCEFVEMNKNDRK